MAFITVQKLILVEDGKVKSGSAAIIETEYDSTNSGKSRHRVCERLGKIVTLSLDRKSGLFLSPTRGAWFISIVNRTASKKWAAKIQGLKRLNCLQIL